MKANKCQKKKYGETDEHLGAETTNVSMSILRKRRLEEIQRDDVMRCMQTKGHMALTGVTGDQGTSSTLPIL